MTAPAEIYHKVDGGADDKLVILNTRAYVRYPFEADNWTDLRIGFFVSLTSTGADNTITGLAETTIGSNLTSDLGYYIGAYSNVDPLPGELRPSTFIGFTNFPGRISVGTGKLLSSDIGQGTSNTDFWRPDSTLRVKIYGAIIDQQIPLATFTSAIQPHFVQNYAGGHAPGYATLLGIRMTRPTATSNTLTVQIKSGTLTGDILFSSTPTSALLDSNLAAFPTTVQQVGPVTVQGVPTTLFCYWPFLNSRLRIHAVRVFQAR